VTLTVFSERKNRPYVFESTSKTIGPKTAKCVFKVNPSSQVTYCCFLALLRAWITTIMDPDGALGKQAGLLRCQNPPSLFYLDVCLSSDEQKYFKLRTCFKIGI